MNSLNLQLFITVASSLVFSLVLIPVIIELSYRFDLLDRPNVRKVHANPVPALGGVGIFISAVMAVGLSRQGLNAVNWWPILFSSLFALFIVGIWDDIKNISAGLRFAVQFCCALAFAAAGLRLNSLYGILGIYELQPFWQYFLTIIIVVGVTNAFNLIDGLDGFAGGIAFINVIVLGFLAFILQLYPLLIIMLAFAGALLGFLTYNLSPARIFMGNGGALILGFLMSAASILLLRKADAYPQLMDASRAAVLIISILLMPVMDALRVFALRISQGVSPFKADRNHIHHLFLVAGFNQRRATYILYSMQIGLIIIATRFNTLHITLVIVIMLMAFHLIIAILRLNYLVEFWLKVVRQMEVEDTAR